MNFIAIDFETATSQRNSACAIGLVTVENGIIIEEYSTFIQPPNNEYNWHNTNVHGITEMDTYNAPNFGEVYQEIEKRIAGKMLVAHNESFDRSVLTKSMLSYGLDYADLGKKASKLWFYCIVLTMILQILKMRIIVHLS